MPDRNPIPACLSHLEELVKPHPSLRLETNGIDRPSYPADQVVTLLQDASSAVHGSMMTEWQRRQDCLLAVAAEHILALQDTVRDLLQDTRRLRAQRNAARHNHIKPDWWNGTDDPESSYSGPSDALDDLDYGDIIGLAGAAEIEQIWGFRLPAAPDSQTDDERDVWCDSKEEAKRKLKEMRDADAVIEAALDAGDTADV